MDRQGVTSSSLIQFKGVTKIYGRGQTTMWALNRVDLSIDYGEFVAIMGPSGSGKSTCLNILGCLDLPTEGNYLFEEVSVGTLSLSRRALLRRHFLGFVFQGFNLLNRTSALENVELPLIYRRITVKERRQMAMDALAVVGLADRARHTPAELSGGQQQRVAIARAIVGRPRVLLADEPTGNLDSVRSGEILEMLANLNQKENITIVMVTHEAKMANFAGRQIHFVDGKVTLDTKNKSVAA